MKKTGKLVIVGLVLFNSRYRFKAILRLRNHFNSVNRNPPGLAKCVSQGVTNNGMVIGDNSRFVAVHQRVSAQKNPQMYE